MKNFVIHAKTLFLIAVVGISIFFWVRGFMNSPLWIPELKTEKEYIEKYILTNSPNHKREKQLAEAYWLRYQDVREHTYWGKNGPLNIWGARDHYTIHGRKEGRIFAPLSYPENLKLEAELAKAYWKRYPDIAKSTVWGSQSQLGILGPRDHFKYMGHRQGKVWGLQPDI